MHDPFRAGAIPPWTDPRMAGCVSLTHLLMFHCASNSVSIAGIKGSMPPGEAKNLACVTSLNIFHLRHLFEHDCFILVRKMAVQLH